LVSLTDCLHFGPVISARLPNAPESMTRRGKPGKIDSRSSPVQNPSARRNVKLAFR
jgi:hypothetical protein